MNPTDERKERVKEADRERKKNRPQSVRDEENKKRREKYAVDPDYKQRRMETYSSYNEKRLSIDDTYVPKATALKRIEELKKTAPPSEAPREFSSLEVRKILGLKHYEYYRLVDGGLLKAYKVGKNYKVSESALLEYIHSAK